MDKFMLCVVALITIVMLIVGNLRRPAWQRAMRTGRVGRKLRQRSSANEAALDL